MSDPLADALDALLKQPERNISSIRLGPDGLLEPYPLYCRNDVVDAFATTNRTVPYWRRSEWWPGTKDPQPFEVCAHELDKALQQKGLATASTRRARKGDPLNHAGEQRGGIRDPRLAHRNSGITNMIPLESLMGKLEISEGLDDDIANARKVEARLRQLLTSIPTESLADPARARVFTSLSETCTKTLQRISQQEASMLKTQRERGQLVSVDVAHQQVGKIVDGLIEELDEVIRDVVDLVKDTEIETHGSSKIDSMSLEDNVRRLFNSARNRAANLLELDEEIVDDESDKDTG